MNEIIINNTSLGIKEYNEQRVVTFRDIDEVHKRPEGTARKRFNDNKKHFIEGVDYFVRNSDEAKTEFGITAPNGLMLITESGYYMLVKSFTDDLSWAVQRELTNSYFRVQQIQKLREHKQVQTAEDKAKAIEAKLMNARVRMSNQYLKLANVDTVSQEYKNILVAKSAEVLTGQPLLPLAKSEQKTYSAGDIAEMFGVSAQKIGHIAKANNMKTDEYGSWYRDKSPYSNKEVDTFRYNDKAVEKFRSLIY